MSKELNMTEPKVRVGIALDVYVDKQEDEDFDYVEEAMYALRHGNPKNYFYANIHFE